MGEPQEPQACVGHAPGGAPLELAEAEPDALAGGVPARVQALEIRQDPRVAGSSARGTLACVGVAQAGAGLLADGLGAAASAAMTLLLEDGSLEGRSRLAALAGLGIGAWTLGMLGSAMLADRGVNERSCLPLRATFLVASLVLASSVGAALGARFLSHDEDLSVQVLTAAIARAVGFFIAEATLQALDRALPKAELEAPEREPLALPGAPDPVVPGALAQVVAAPPASWSHLGIGLATSLAGHFGASPLARAVAGRGLDGGLGPRATSLFIEQLPLVLARALTRLHHAAQAARAVDASGLQVRLAAGPIRSFGESIGLALAQSGARASTGGAARDLLTWLAAVAGSEPAWHHLFPLLQGMADQLGQVASDRLAHVDLATSDYRGMLVEGEQGEAWGVAGVHDPRAYFERHQVLYGGPDSSWRGRERAQVVELPPEGVGEAGGAPAAEA